MNSYSNTQFINFLQKELFLTVGDIAIALRKHQLNNEPLAMLLWQYGLVDIEQLERILDWLETNQ
ncbi:DUF2949 domain-containing protein [Scytonema sp. UIC 10036]|uniref:DUF2949 domain-containing protein n=1 Tax=Scytonema sp. UIC 10036 TaxID=2304196 RepID=UPI0012DA2F80|nr:DUF2949 domain-containing protein [Scytonema sp. UIC 10036]MUG91684.1 DUF2949 domain-containing protein [Scytonema sp. UIC 10036]